MRFAAGLPEPISPRSALRRSLLVWGWGQVATGDKRGYALAALELTWLSGFVLIGLPILPGAGTELIFVAGAAFVATWVIVGVHAYRRAIHRRERLGLEGADGGAVDLVWLAVPLLLVSTAFWAAAGRQGSPEATLARYEEAWFEARPDDALGLIVGGSTSGPAGGSGDPLSSGSLVAAWDRQVGRLHDELTELVAGLGPGSGIDPDEPLESLRIRVVAAPGPGGDESVGIVSIVRRVVVRESIFGVVPTSAQRFVDVAEVGRVRLRRIEESGPWPAILRPSRWTIVEIDLLGEHVGGG